MVIFFGVPEPGDLSQSRAAAQVVVGGSRGIDVLPASLVLGRQLEPGDRSDGRAKQMFQHALHLPK